MVGAGQLARMTHRAAIDLGVELRVLRNESALAADANPWPVVHETNASRRYELFSGVSEGQGGGVLVVASEPGKLRWWKLIFGASRVRMHRGSKGALCLYGRAYGPGKISVHGLTG